MDIAAFVYYRLSDNYFQNHGEKENQAPQPFWGCVVMPKPTGFP